MHRREKDTSSVSFKASNDKDDDEEEEDDDDDDDDDANHAMVYFACSGEGVTTSIDIGMAAAT